MTVKLALHPKGRDWCLAEMARLDDADVRYGKIAAALGVSTTTVSVNLRDMGRRKRTHGVRSPRAKNHKRTCIDCGLVEMVRMDHKHTERCWPCTGRLKVGTEPPNKGTRTRIRTCETCKVEFPRLESYMNRRPRYRWGTYCSHACRGIAMRTPGSRYSEVHNPRNRSRR